MGNCKIPICCDILGSATLTLKVITRCIPKIFVPPEKFLATKLVILATYTCGTTGNRDNTIRSQYPTISNFGTKIYN